MNKQRQEEEQEEDEEEDDEEEQEEKQDEEEEQEEDEEDKGARGIRGGRVSEFFFFRNGNKRSRRCIQSQGASLQPYDPFHFCRLSMQGFLPPTLRGLIGCYSRMPSSLPYA